VPEKQQNGILFGAAYYHEYQPTPRLEEDLDLMAAAGFTVIRVGESVWSTWEPREGEFDLDWLQPVLDGAHSRGIGVILGTPTYAIPMWMKRLHPEVAADSASGVSVPWGSRQEMDFTDEHYRAYAERIIRAVVGRYRDHPAIIGYQVDNEPGVRLLYNASVFRRFVTSLAEQYGDVETLNREWGLVYWSHRLSEWDDLWLPDGNFQPQYDLAWRRFQAGLVTEFIGWQADIVREIARDDQFVTTCISYDQVGVEDVDLAAELDIASGNAYYEMEDALEHPSSKERSTGWIVKGTWALYQLADLMYSSRQAPFLVTETNAGSIGHSSLNFSPYDGQWRQAAWALISRGANMIEYWHWHTLHFGAETYWGGVLPHSGRPGRVYGELAALGAELKAAGPAVSSCTPDSDIVFLYDSDSKFALSSQPPFAAPGQYFDPDSYRRIFSTFYRGAFDAGLQASLARPRQLFGSRGATVSPADYAAAHPVLVVPAFFTAADGDLEWLDAYASAGGHLVLGPRTGYADREGRARADVQPAMLSEAAGVWYDEFANLTTPVQVSANDPSAPGGIDLEVGSAALDWVDGLTVAGAEAVVSYEHPHLGRWAAVTTARHGTGRITVIGTVPNQQLARSIAAWLVPNPTAGWADLPPSVTVASRSGKRGERVFFTHNWSWEPTVVPAPLDLVDLTSKAHFVAGDGIPLAAWDVRVLGKSPAAS
jgi:beta-galactosidase